MSGWVWSYVRGAVPLAITRQCRHPLAHVLLLRAFPVLGAACEPSRPGVCLSAGVCRVTRCFIVKRVLPLGW